MIIALLIVIICILAPGLALLVGAGMGIMVLALVVCGMVIGLIRAAFDRSVPREKPLPYGVVNWPRAPDYSPMKPRHTVRQEHEPVSMWERMLIDEANR